MLDGETSDDRVAHVTAKMAELRTEIKDLRAKADLRVEELNRLETYLAVHRDYFDPPGQIDQISEAETAPIILKKTAPAHKGAPRSSPPGIRQAEFVPFVRAMLLEHGRPMDKREILEGFKKRGRYIGGKPELELKNLGKKLARAEKAIIRISGAGYWPTDVPCPEVSYIPP